MKGGECIVLLNELSSGTPARHHGHDVASRDTTQVGQCMYYNMSGYLRAERKPVKASQRRHFAKKYEQI